MKKFIRFISVITIIALIGTAFTGCSNEPKNFLAVGVSNIDSNRLDFSQEDKALSDIILTSLSVSGSGYSLMELDGEPYKISSGTVEYDVGISNGNKRLQLEKAISDIYTAFEEKAIPVTPEFDMIESINALAESVNNLAYGESDARKTIIIVSNLISTTGMLDFTGNKLYSDLSYFSEFLKPELSLENIDVKIFITKPTGKQADLPFSMKNELKEFYNSLLTTAGASSVEFIDADMTKNDSEALKDYPSVTTVAIRENTFDGQTLDYTIEENMAFLPNSTTLVNSEASEAMFKDLAEKVNSLSSPVSIIGSTATTNSSAERHLAFGLERAKIIKNKLLEAGVSPDKIEGVYSVGKENHKFRVPDTENFSSEKNHEKNRCVYIVSFDSKKGQELIKLAEKFPINKN